MDLASEVFPSIYGKDFHVQHVLHQFEQLREDMDGMKSIGSIEESEIPSSSKAVPTAVEFTNEVEWLTRVEELMKQCTDLRDAFQNVANENVRLVQVLEALQASDEDAMRLLEGLKESLVKEVERIEAERHRQNEDWHTSAQVVEDERGIWKNKADELEKENKRLKETTSKLEKDKENLQRDINRLTDRSFCRVLWDSLCCCRR